MALSRKKKIVISVAAVAVVALVVIISIAAGRKEEPEVTVVKVESRPELRSTVTASGEVRPVKFINLTSEVAGRIEEIYVNPGDHVTVGQPLVRLDPTQLQSGQEAQAAGRASRLQRRSERALCRLFGREQRRATATGDERGRGEFGAGAASGRLRADGR